MIFHLRLFSWEEMMSLIPLQTSSEPETKGCLLTSTSLLKLGDSRPRDGGALAQAFSGQQ